MRFAVLFPGQGSQRVGMGAELFSARPDLLGRTADDLLGWSLEDVCLNGPEEELTRTDRAQPALFALSYVLWEEFSRQLVDLPSAGAGHSLGEYTALSAGGALGFRQGLSLVAARGRAMDSAARLEPAGMAALIGADEEAAEAVAARRRAEGGRLWVANLNGPGQVVLAGGDDDLDWLADEGRSFGIRRVVRLNVAGGFHSPFMSPAADELRLALEYIEPTAPRFPVWSNATARPYTRDTVRELLARQLENPVRFAESLEQMSAHVDVFVHVGPGDVTAGLARRVLPDTEVLVANDLQSASAAAERLATSMARAGEE